MTHLTWSIEKPDGKCQTCGSKTLLLIACSQWEIHEESAIEAIGQKRFEDLEPCVEIGDEVTCHWCPNCDRMTSLSLNTYEPRRAADDERLSAK